MNDMCLPQGFADDVYNAVLEYCTDGFSALEKDLVDLGLDPTAVDSVHKVHGHIIETIKNKLAGNIKTWEGFVSELQSKSALFQKQQEFAAVEGFEASAEEEAQLDKEIDALNKELEIVDHQCRQMEHDDAMLRQALNKGVASTSGALLASSTFENVKSLSGIAARMRPLLEKAYTLQDIGVGTEDRPVLTLDKLHLLRQQLQV